MNRLFASIIFAAVLFWLPPGVLAQSSSSAPISTMTPGQRLAVEKIVRDYLKNNPEIIIEAIRGMQQRERRSARARQRAAAVALKDVLENDPTSPVHGALDGDVTVVEFFDYQCPFCKQVFPTLTELVKTDTKVRLVFKEFPILGPESNLAARVALAIWKQDRAKYMDFHAGLMRARGGLTEKKIFALAGRLGLDVEGLRHDFQSPEIEEILRQNFALADKLRVTGTPGFVVGGEVVAGAVDLAAMKQLVAQARERKKTRIRKK